MVDRLAAAIDSFEQAMFERSKASAEESAGNLELIMSEDGASRLAAWMTAMMSIAAAGGGEADARVDLKQ